MTSSGERALQVAVRLTVYVVLSYAALRISGIVLYWFSGNLLVASTLAVLGAASLANALLMRIYERASLPELGLAWTAASKRNLMLGVAGGAGAALLVLGAAIVCGLAELRAVAGAQTSWPTVAFMLMLLVAGAAGEEMLFHGYGFQLLLGTLGPYATILPVSVLFALAHSGNLNITWLALANTFGWGVLLGYSFWRSRDLWLPIGLHVGWNWVLPLAGVPLSGFTMNLTGYTVRWDSGALWSGGDYGPEGSLLTSAVLLGLAVGVSRAPVKQQQALLLGSREEA